MMAWEGAGCLCGLGECSYVVGMETGVDGVLLCV